MIDKKVSVGVTVTPGQILATLFDPLQMQLMASVRESLAHRLNVPSPFEQTQTQSAARSKFEHQWLSDRMHAAIALVPLTPYSTDAA